MEELANLELTSSIIGVKSYGKTEKELGEILEKLKNDNEIEAYGQTGNTTITGIIFGTIPENGIELEIGADNAVEKTATFTSSDPSQDYYVQIRGKKYPIAKTNGVIKITNTEITTGTNATGEITEVSSNNKSYVTVEKVSGTTDKIKITGVAKGTATITVKYTETIKTSFNVIVKTKYTVAAQTEDINKGSVSISPSSTDNKYEEGSTVSITATEATGYIFEKWNDENTTNPRTISVSEETSGTYIAIFKEKPNPEAGKTTKSNNRTLSGSTDTTKMTYKNPVIPQGFSAIDTTDAKWKYKDETTLDEVEDWNNGLVIQDDLENQFVWVPCTTGTSEDIVTYSKKYDYTTNISSPSSSTIIDYQNTIPVENEATQILTYGGFYVARFEAGLTNAQNDQSATTHANNNTNSTPVSKLGSKVWNYINSSNCNIVAKKMINDSTIYGNNKSGIITGTQWDTIMKWFEKDGITVTGSATTQGWGTYRELGCSGKGYYYTKYGGSSSTVNNWINGAFSFKAATGTESSTKPSFIHGSGLNLTSGYKKNIGDLAGNLVEYTGEVYYYSSTSLKPILRGGGTGNGNCVSFRHGLTAYSSSVIEGFGFRVAIYIQ